jgi:hypothetical protein
MSDARIVAVNWAALTKVVARALPFQFTNEPDTKPVPFTVSVNSAPPGAMASGTSGWLISGTGFAVHVTMDIPVTDLVNPLKANRAPAEQRAKPIKTRGLQKAD